LAARAKDVVDLPDRRLADLLVLIHQSNGHLSNNKRKQRFEELTNGEIAAIESAYAEVFPDCIRRKLSASVQAATRGFTSWLSCRPESCSSFQRSKATCRFSQFLGSTRKYRPKRAAVSGVMDRRPARI
jgi:hypothetical protein